MRARGSAHEISIAAPPVPKRSSFCTVSRRPGLGRGSEGGMTGGTGRGGIGGTGVVGRGVGRGSGVAS